MKSPHTIKAYRYLRTRILTGALGPGAFLSAQGVSREIGISRTPVREALRLLECDELVTIAPRVGAIVKALSREQFGDLMGYREALETYTAGKAAAMRRSDEVDELQSTLRRMIDPMNTLLKNPQERRAMALFGECDVTFHRLLFAMGRNSIVQSKFEQAQILQRVLIAALIAHVPTDDDAVRENVRTVFREHTAIFEAIRAGDAHGARSAMAQHMRSFIAKASKRTEDPPIETINAGSFELLI